MNKIPITICLFESTQGHWKIKTRYLETLNCLNKHIPLNNFEQRIASIKVTPNEEGEATFAEMKKNLENFGFIVSRDDSHWSHDPTGKDNSHQEGYLSDIWRMYSSREILVSKYVLHLEGDWLFDPVEGELLEWFSKALKVLDENPHLSQVRFPRFANEFDRINNLAKKHGIPGQAQWVNEDYFISNDFSLNPCIFRPRDLFHALILMQANPQAFQRHVEMGMGGAFKYLCGFSLPLAVLNPTKINIKHIGSPFGSEDKLSMPINADL